MRGILWGAVALTLACAIPVEDQGGAFGSAGAATGPPGDESTQGAESDAGSGSGTDSGESTESSGSDSDGSSSSSSSSSSGSDSGGGGCTDGVRDDDEICDGNDLDGETCQGLGFEQGMLGCTVTCEYDTTECVSCGDGIQNGNEQCDGNDFGGSTCMQLGWDMGQLACTQNCTFDTSDCEDMPCAQKGQPCADADDCCNTGCGKGGSVCIMNGQNVCCT
jgi:hypothetical protein